MLEQQLTALHIFKTNLNTFLLNKEGIMEGYEAVKSFREGNPLPGCRSCPGEGLLNRFSGLNAEEVQDPCVVAVHKELSSPGSMWDAPACPGGLQKWSLSALSIKHSLYIENKLY